MEDTNDLSLYIDLSATIKDGRLQSTHDKIPITKKKEKKLFGYSIRFLQVSSDLTAAAFKSIMQSLKFLQGQAYDLQIN